MTQWVQSEQFGGAGGEPFADPLTSVKRVVGFRIQAGQRVDNIQALLWTDAGVVWGPDHGGGRGDLYEVILEPDEQATEIVLQAHQQVDSIQIITNKRSYGPFGGQGGDRQHRIPVGVLGGFTGRSGVKVNALGLWYQPAIGASLAVAASEQPLVQTQVDPVAIAPAAPELAKGPAIEEKTEFDVILTAVGAGQINVIKLIREITALGLKEAREALDAVPIAIKEQISKEQATLIAAKLIAAGATVEVR